MRRRHRLRRSADFDQLWRRGQRWHHPLLLLVVGPNELEISRFGFAASRRLGKAYSRNKVKRILREVVRNRLKKIEGGWDCLFVARFAANGVTFSEVEAAVSQLLKRSDLLLSNSDALVSNVLEERLT